MQRESDQLVKQGKILDHVGVCRLFERQYKRAADQRSGAYSILTGIAANKSMKSGQAVRIKDLVKGLRMPDYPRMPTGKGKLDPKIKARH